MSERSLLRDLKSITNVTVVIAGLGYFVDIFDLTLFPVVRVASLHDLGISDGPGMLNASLFIFNMQMAGMMLGGIIWGVLADRRGRVPIMFASIIMYSVANIACAFAWDVNSYAAFRFIGCLGLAGELGAAVALVAESLPAHNRVLGTTVVATLGMLGAVASGIVGQQVSWRAAYVIGGVMGLLLFVARLRLTESALFLKVGNLRVSPAIILTRRRFPRYFMCVLIGLPISFATGILVTFAPELARTLDVRGAITPGNAVLAAALGLALGDILVGLLSHVLMRRRLALAVSLTTGFVAMLTICLLSGVSSATVYALLFLVGLTVGYWSVLVMFAAEQFGTNIRGMVATTVPAFVRGSALFVGSAFAWLKGVTTIPAAAAILGSVCFLIAAVALWSLDETFGRDLDFTE